MSRKLTIEEIKRRLYEVHGDVVTLDENTYIDTQHRAKFTDKDYGEWWAMPYKILCEKQSHPERKQTKTKQTNLEKYDCEYPLQNKKIQEKTKQTNLEKYGCERPLQNKKIQEKTKQTCVEKYGCENPSQNKVIQEKIKQTCLEKYGHGCPLQNEQIKDKAKQTMVRKYGCGNPSQNKDIAQKAARHQTTSTILKHWKTGEEIVCVASYEPKVVQYFNDKKIDFKWQVRFDMPNGKKYFVDCYLPEQDVYIEIKGYFRKDAKEKWDWFHKKHPNSELWDKKKLKELNILIGVRNE